MSCDNCGDNSVTIRCGNPCGVSVTNTAACESLPSQIENFTLQFFGTVVKTEVDGVVSWSLPCSLDVGLPNNPRGVDEGLACYFLRLFSEGIVGLTGPAGAAGPMGDPGNNAYTVVLKGFDQPLGDPRVQVLTAFNPAIVPGLFVFIQDAGWYRVENTDGAGTLSLVLTNPLPGVFFVPAGKLVVPSGYPGRDGLNGADGHVGPQGFTGAKGDKGDKGDKGNTGATGATGPAAALENGVYTSTGGTDFLLTDAYQKLDFTASVPELTLGAAGTYLITAIVEAFSANGVNKGVSVKLYNASTPADIYPEHSVFGFPSTSFRHQIVLNIIITTVNFGDVIQLYGKLSSASGVAIKINADATTMTFVKIA